jgi:sodium transport system ATP-binding protein
MIHVDHLQKSFRDKVAVREVSFTAADGVVTGLLGPNGAGKTTTLRMVAGLAKPDRGTVMVDDCAVWPDPKRALARLGVLPDQTGLYSRLTAREHVRYFGALHGLGGAALEARIDQCVSLLDLQTLADRRVAGFSNGERMKVALARTLVHDPQNILLDEPTNGLDVMSTRALRATIRRLRDEGRCLVFSSHVMPEVSAVCDHVVVLASGLVAAYGTPDEIMRIAGKSSLEDAFVMLSDQTLLRDDEAPQ